MLIKATPRRRWQREDTQDQYLHYQTYPRLSPDKYGTMTMTMQSDLLNCNFKQHDYQRRALLRVTRQTTYRVEAITNMVGLCHDKFDG